MKLYNFYFGIVSWDLDALRIDLRRDDWRHVGPKHLAVRRRHSVTAEVEKTFPNEDWEIVEGIPDDPYDYQYGDAIVPGLEVSLANGQLVRYDDWRNEMDDENDDDDLN